MKFLRYALADLRRPPSAQIPFLDFLRTLAILLVINGHVGEFFTERYGGNRYSRFTLVENGWIGVDLFFVLSGFFIGRQIWKELSLCGTIKVQRFLIRRGLRIWPLYFFVFICVLILIFSSASSRQYGWSDLVFLTNYLNHGIVLGSWSLATEEQFYLVVPVAVFALSHRFSEPTQFRPWLWGIFVAAPVIRALYWVRYVSLATHSPELFRHLYYPSYLHFDGLIMGLIVSNYAMSEAHREWRWLKPSIILVLGVLLLSAEHAIHKELLDFQGLGFLFGALVWYGFTRETSVVRSRIFYWGSRLSFGMYLNHAYLIKPIGRLVPAGVTGELVSTAAVVLVSMLLALLTFCFVETPFLYWRTHLLSSKTTKGATMIAV